MSIKKKVLIIVGSSLGGIALLNVILILAVSLLLFAPRRIGTYLMIDSSKIENMVVTVETFDEDDFNMTKTEYKIREPEKLLKEIRNIKVTPKYLLCKCIDYPRVVITFTYNNKEYIIATNYISIGKFALPIKYQEAIYWAFRDYLGR